jgi:hypothetical protein
VLQGFAGVEDVVAGLGELAGAAGFAALDVADVAGGEIDLLGHGGDGQLFQIQVSAQFGAESVLGVLEGCELFRLLSHDHSPL